MRKELEKEIIGGILVDNNNVSRVAQIVSLEDFAFYRDYYEALFDIWKQGEEKNLPIELSNRGFKGSEVVEMMESFYSRPIETACNDLKEISTNQKTKSLLEQALKNFPTGGVSNFIADLQQKLVHSVSTFTNEKPDAESVLNEFREYQLVYEEKQKNGQELLGLDTGYKKLNNIIDGLRKGHLWIIGGYTNLGKTFGALNIVTNLIEQEKRVVFYSLEMSRVDIVARMLGIMCNENGTAISKGYVDHEKVQPKIDVLKKSNMSIYNEKTELSQILLSMYEETLKHDVEAFFVDFLQLIKVSGAKSEYEQMTEAALELQKAAQKYNIPVVVLSQVSNESARGGDQMVMGFRGSGSIASAADFAIELISGEESVKDLRDKMDKGEAVKIKWVIKKNRHGRVGYVPMEFHGKTGVFKEENENF